jgi:phage/plasmid-like protein (TIGR03299 family)
MATEARFTSVRVVCNNTLTAAAQQDAKVRVTHKQAFDPAAAKEQLGLKLKDGRLIIEETIEAYRKMAQTPISHSEMLRMTLRIFGHEPADMDRDELEEAMGTRAFRSITELAINEDHLQGANLFGGSGTVWAWLNAVTQYVDHHARARSTANRLDSAWFGRGDTLKNRALDLASKLARILGRG